MSINDLLKELQLEYIQSLPEKMMEIETHLKSQNLELLINAFHKLKGSGKTYGLEEVTILGQFFESWLRKEGTKAMPFANYAIAILKRIEDARKKQTPYDMTKDIDFKKLESMK